MQKTPSALVHKVAPLAASNRGPHPALVLVHGRGANEDDLLGLVPYFDPRFLVVSVRAPLPFAGGYTWFDLAAVGDPEPDEFLASHARFGQFLDEMRSSLPVDPERIFLLGFSMGSVMSLARALCRPAEIRGVVAHSGYLPEHSSLNFQWERLGGCRFYVAHGTLDPVIPVQFGRRAQALLSERGADVTYREYPIGHSMNEESIGDIAWWLTENLDSRSGS